MKRLLSLFFFISTCFAHESFETSLLSNKAIAISIVIFISITLFLLYALQQKRRKDFIESLLENMGNGVYSVDRWGRCLLINKKALDILGFSEDEVIGQDQHALFHYKKIDGSDYDVKECPIYKTSQSGETIKTFEYFIKKDGSFVPVELTTSALGNDGGSIVIFRDITHEIELQKKIEISHQRYNSLLDTMQEMVFIKDSKLRYIITNKALEEFFGKTKNELFGKKDSDLMPKENAHYFELSDLKTLEMNDTLISQENIGDKIFETHKFPLDIGYDEIGLGCFIIDVTQKTHFQQQILETNKKLELTLEASKIGTWEWNIPKDKVIWDKRCFEMLGMQENEKILSYEAVKSLTHPQDRDNLHDQVQQQLAKGDTFRYEFRLQKKDGGYLWIEGRGKVIQKDKQGKATRLIGTHTNITPTKEHESILKEEIRKKTEENLKQFELIQEQSKLAAMGEMIGNIAHQWRQPLNALNINIQNLEEDYEEGLITKEFVDRFIDKNDSIIQFMSRTIDDFRDFFKINKEKECFAVKKCIQEVIDIQMASLKSNSIDIALSGENFDIEGFRSEFAQVILNIISNSKDAIIQKGLPEGKISITIEKNSICIQDNGGGIDEDVLQRVFEPYFTTKEQGKGTGIGLYMSKMIIEQNMGGVLSMKNIDDGVCAHIDFEEGL